MTKPLTLTIRGSSGGGVSNHNDLSGIQGGTASEYYHLTSAEHVINTQAANTTLSGYLTSTDWNTFNGKQSALGFTPEDVSNKENTTIDTSTTKYPTVNLLNTGLSSKENVANKENTTIDTSTSKYPTVNLLKVGLDLKQDAITFKEVSFDYRIKITNNIIIVQNTTADITLDLPTVKYAYKKIFNVVNESSFKVTLQARDFDTFYTNTQTLELTNTGESVQIAAFKRWHILNRFIP